MEVQSNSIKINDLQINYKLCGNLEAKTKALVLHGWNQNGSQSWLEFLGQNSNPDILFISLDLPCFGVSDCPKSVWDTTNYADFCIQFVAKMEDKYSFKNNQWTLIGHSFGGAVATLMAALIPEKIEKLILIAPAIVRRQLNNKQKLIQRITKVFKYGSNLPILKHLKPIATKIWYKLIGSPDYNLTSGIKREIMKTILKQNWTSKLALVKAKSLLIWGTKDSYTPFSDFNLVSNELKPAKSLIYEDYGHGIHIQNPTKLFTDVVDFISNS